LKESAFNNQTEQDAPHTDGAPRNWYDSPANHANFAQEVARLEEAYEAAKNESVVYGRIAHALAQNCVDLFYVNMDNDEYVEYHTGDESGSLTERRRGADFFESCKREAKQFVHPDDQIAFVAAMNRDFLTEVLNRSKTFEITYRRIKDERTFFVNMKVSRTEDNEHFIVIAVTDIDELVRRRLVEEQMQEERLEQARSLANIDALTGVRNKHAYLEAEARIDRRIKEQDMSPFAIVMLDVNDLKKVNDTAGHQAGDELIQGACKAICNIFKHSPVFRIGGDEFTVIAQGEDYTHLDERLAEMRDYNAEASRTGGAIIACGMAWFRDDACVARVFERADRNMYEDKGRLKLHGA